MATVNETAKLAHWLRTDYSWCEMLTTCDMGLNSGLLMAFQGVINTGALVGSAVIFFKDDSQNYLPLGIGITAGALAVNCLFLSTVCFLKYRYRCCKQSFVFTDMDKIMREKCCYDTTIGLSVVFTLLTTATLVTQIVLKR